jgi:hypothetical protein
LFVCSRDPRAQTPRRRLTANFWIFHELFWQMTGSAFVALIAASIAALNFADFFASAIVLPARQCGAHGASQSVNVTALPWLRWSAVAIRRHRCCTSR